jgi:hypothetical protein
MLGWGTYESTATMMATSKPQQLQPSCSSHQALTAQMHLVWVTWCYTLQVACCRAFICQW